MGDRIALLDAGELQQVATPRDLVESPASEFVDQFLGRHRFQLSLLTRTLESVDLVETDAPEQAPDRRPPEALGARQSLIDALDRFKQTDAKTLLVYRGDKWIGHVRRQRLLEAITEVLSELEKQT
jgi:osmoprotectant transport system ATP-binding protein